MADDFQFPTTFMGINLSRVWIKMSFSYIAVGLKPTKADWEVLGSVLSFGKKALMEAPVSVTQF